MFFEKPALEDGSPVEGITQATLEVGKNTLRVGKNTLLGLRNKKKTL